MTPNPEALLVISNLSNALNIRQWYPKGPMKCTIADILLVALPWAHSYHFPGAEYPSGLSAMPANPNLNLQQIICIYSN